MMAARGIGDGAARASARAGGGHRSASPCPPAVDHPNGSSGRGPAASPAARPAHPPTHAAYPFAAIVGMADLKLALLLNAVSPAIGGVLAARTARTRTGRRG